MPCEPGSYQELHGETACKMCPSGHYCDGGSASPTPCEAGRFAPTTGLNSSSQCLPCTRGFYCRQGTSDPTPCAEGTRGRREFLTSDSDCERCPYPSYSAAGSEACDGATHDESPLVLGQEMYFQHARAGWVPVRVLQISADGVDYLVGGEALGNQRIETVRRKLFHAKPEWTTGAYWRAPSPQPPEPTAADAEGEDREQGAHHGGDLADDVEERVELA